MTEYDDIIDLPRPKSKHEPMPMSDRAAQFSPDAHERPRGAVFTLCRAHRI